MAKNKENEIFENPEAIVEQIDKTEDFIKRNKTIFLGVVVAIVLLVFGGMFWKNSNADKELEASNAIYVAEDYFRKDSLELAKNGDGDNKGFTFVASEYSGTKAGALAEYYLGCIALKQGELELAAEKFSKYDSDAFLVQARAYALAGDAYSDLGQVDQAISFYVKASENGVNKEFTPKYLIKLGLAYENTGRFSDAVLTYEKFVADYPNDSKINDVKKNLAKTTILAGKKKG